MPAHERMPRHRREQVVSFAPERSVLVPPILTRKPRVPYPSLRRAVSPLRYRRWPWGRYQQTHNGGI